MSIAVSKTLKRNHLVVVPGLTPTEGLHSPTGGSPLLPAPLGVEIRQHSQHYYPATFDVNIQVLARYNNCPINNICRFKTVYADVQLFLLTLITA